MPLFGRSLDLSNMEGTLFLEFSHISMKLMKTGTYNDTCTCINVKWYCIIIIVTGRQRHSSVRLLPMSPGGTYSKVSKSSVVIIIIIITNVLDRTLR